MGRMGARISAEKRARVVEMWSKGKPYVDIVDELGISRASVGNIIRDARVKADARSSIPKTEKADKKAPPRTLNAAHIASQEHLLEHVEKLNALIEKLETRVEDGLEGGLPTREVKDLLVSMAIAQDKRDCAIRELERLEQKLGTTVKRRPKFSRNVVPMKATKPTKPKAEGSQKEGTNDS